MDIIFFWNKSLKSQSNLSLTYLYRKHRYFSKHFICFAIVQVSYNISGWLEKNKDPLNDTVVDQFKKGTNKLLIEIFADHPGQSGGAPADAGGKGKIIHLLLISILMIKLYLMNR